MILQLLFVLAAIIVGARLGGIGLGVMGGAGMAVLVFFFGLEPTSPPIDVMLMIAAVISAAAAMQAAGGLDYLVSLAEKLLRKHPSQVTVVSPLVTYLFTFVAGTGHVAYSAATVALLGLLTAAGISLFDILKITIPATLCGVLVGALLSKRVGKELMDDPEYQRRVKEGMIEENDKPVNRIENVGKARLSVILFLLATVLIVLFGSIPSMRPVFEGTPVGMPAIIEILMLTTCALILIFTKTNGITPTQGSVFIAGMQAVIAIFGIAWMGDTFINGNLAAITAPIEGIVRDMPWLFAVALFVMSILLYSQAATVRAIMPLGVALGISPMMLIALFPAVNGYFFIPNYPTIVAAINFDRTGTTHIGKWVLNHSFMMPGMVATIVAIGVGLLLIQIF